LIITKPPGSRKLTRRSASLGSSIAHLEMAVAGVLCDKFKGAQPWRTGADEVVCRHNAIRLAFGLPMGNLLLAVILLAARWSSAPLC